MDAITPPSINERPIIFSAAMVRAILEGRKTQTRRLVKSWGKLRLEVNGPDAINSDLYEECPYGQPGARLWVRETWGVNEALSPRHHVIYGAEFRHRPGSYAKFCRHDPVAVNKWKPSIHMPRWASRILLEVVSVRVERLHALSELDAIAEGVECWQEGNDKLTWRVDEFLSFKGACDAFWQLWNSINGYGSVDANPWIWVIEFKRVHAA